MKPYYEDNFVTLYHGDCRDVLPALSADVTVTDPPYGVGLRTKMAKNHGRGGSHPVGNASVVYGDDPEQTKVLIGQVVPLMLSVTPRALIFCGFRMLHSYPPPVVIGAVFVPQGSGYTPWGFQTSQPILYYGADPYLADGKGNRPNGFLDSGAKGETFDHPCPKPLRWMVWAVNRASREGETVLDPFAGTGTTLVAAKGIGRRAIGIEVEEKYCEIAAGRLAQGVLDLNPPPVEKPTTDPLFQEAG